jgi:hypothetical protein
MEDKAKMSWGMCRVATVSSQALKRPSGPSQRTPNPTLVAILELQLQALQKAEAALPPERKAWLDRSA